MTIYISNRDGDGKTSEEGHYKFQTSVFSGAVLGAEALKVVQTTPASLNVLIQAGQFKIDTGMDYSYTGWSNSNVSLTLPTPDTANARIVTIVAYVDKSAPTAPTPPNNPNIAFMKAVSGVPSAVPSAPSAATIQSEVGASNPYIVLANVYTAASATSVTNANITDMREQVYLSSNVVSTQSLRDGSVTSSKLSSSAVITDSINNLAVTAPKIANGAVTTAKFSPSLIRSNFPITSSRYSTPASTGRYTIPNATMSYTAGVTNETLILWISGMASKPSNNAELMLYVNGAEYGQTAYLQNGTQWYRMNAANMLDVNAGQTVELSLVINNQGANVTQVATETERFKPSIVGFSVYRP